MDFSKKIFLTVAFYCTVHAAQATAQNSCFEDQLNILRMQYKQNNPKEEESLNSGFATNATDFLNALNEDGLPPLLLNTFFVEQNPQDEHANEAAP